MITITTLQHLEQFGIIPLTSESDNLGFRTLCDLTPRGVKIMEECFGLSCVRGSNWNNAYGQVASCMLSHHSIQPLAIIALVLAGHTVIETDRAMYGLESDEQYIEAVYDWNAPIDTRKLWPSTPGTMPILEAAQLVRAGETMPWPDLYGKVLRVYKSDKMHPHEGTRNVHAMLGRAK